MAAIVHFNSEGCGRPQHLVYVIRNNKIWQWHIICCNSDAMWPNHWLFYHHLDTVHLYYSCLVNKMAESRPVWHKPVAKDTCKLKFLNSLTRQKVLVISVYECLCVCVCVIIHDDCMPFVLFSYYCGNRTSLFHRTDGRWRGIVVGQQSTMLLTWAMPGRYCTFQ